MIRAAMLQLADQKLVLNAQRESAVQVRVNSKHTGPHAEVLVDSVTLRNTAAENPPSVLLMCIVKMALHVTVTRLTASPENAKHTMHSASTTSEAVSN